MSQEKPTKPNYQPISFDSLNAFCDLHKINFRDREDSMRVYKPGMYIGKEIAWEWIEGRLKEWNQAVEEM